MHKEPSKTYFLAEELDLKKANNIGSLLYEKLSFVKTSESETDKPNESSQYNQDKYPSDKWPYPIDIPLDELLAIFDEKKKMNKTYTNIRLRLENI